MEPIIPNAAIILQWLDEHAPDHARRTRERMSVSAILPALEILQAFVEEDGEQTDGLGETVRAQILPHLQAIEAAVRVYERELEREYRAE